MMAGTRSTRFQGVLPGNIHIAGKVIAEEALDWKTPILPRNQKTKRISCICGNKRISFYNRDYKMKG